MSDVSSWSVVFTCPNSGKRVSRSDPGGEVCHRQYEGAHVAFVIYDCPCGEKHEIYVCGVSADVH